MSGALPSPNPLAARWRLALIVGCFAIAPCEGWAQADFDDGSDPELPAGDEGADLDDDEVRDDADVQPRASDSTELLDAIDDRLEQVEAAEPGSLSQETLENAQAPSAAPRQTRFFRDISGGLPAVAFTAVAVDPGDPEIILAGTDGFVFKSDDGGESWRPTLSFARGLAADLLGTEEGDDDGAAQQGDLLVQDRNIQPVDENDQQQSPEVAQVPMLVGGDGDLPIGDFEDGVGRAAVEAMGVRSITFVSSSTGTAFVGSPRGAWRSVDQGDSWQRLNIPGGPPANDVRDISVNPNRPSRVWFATRAGLLVSPDGGATFTAVATGGRVPALSVVAADVLDQPVVIVGTDRGLWRSWDDGTSFRKLLLQGVDPNEPVGELAIDQPSAVFYAGTPSGLFVAERRIAIFERRLLFKGQEVVAISPDPQRPRGAAIGVVGAGVQMTENTGFTTLTLAESFPAETARALARRGDDPDAIIAATNRGVFMHQEGSGVQVSSDRMRALYELWSREPTLAEIVEEAIRYQGVHPERFANIEERTRLSALAPRLSALYRFTLGRPEDQEEYVVTGDEPADYDPRNQADVLELYDLGLAERAPQVGTNHYLWLSAIWNLDRFLYTPWEPVANAHRRLQRTYQRLVAGQVQTTFSARRRLVVEILQHHEVNPIAAARRQVRLEELTALLDGASGGAFTRISQERGADLGVLDKKRR